jgi:hypothetical protein
MLIFLSVRPGFSFLLIRSITGLDQESIKPSDGDYHWRRDADNLLAAFDLSRDKCAGGLWRA